MKIMDKVYGEVLMAEQSPRPLSNVTINLSSDELELVLAGLKHLHRAYSNCHEHNDIENCRLVSDLYYGLRY